MKLGARHQCGIKFTNGNRRYADHSKSNSPITFSIIIHKTTLCALRSMSPYPAKRKSCENSNSIILTKALRNYRCCHFSAIKPNNVLTSYLQSINEGPKTDRFFTHGLVFFAWISEYTGKRPWSTKSEYFIHYISFHNLQAVICCALNSKKIYSWSLHIGI